MTGASRGLGYALATTLAGLGWSLVIDARHEDSLEQAREDFSLLADPLATITAIPGDVADPAHRAAIAAVVGDRPLELLVNNASILGPSPQPPLDGYPLDVLRMVFEVNVIAPLALIQELTPALRLAQTPRVVNITSDASVEPYEGWGGYG
ncbi:MAG: SDR family NAD(P)-dependent oxidoreductase, partial [Acidimicrobiales bacterium]